jgi:hypothetical protein
MLDISALGKSKKEQGKSKGWGTISELVWATWRKMIRER